MTWAARYSRTEQPELTIYRGWEAVARIAIPHDDLDDALSITCKCGSDLRADIAARVPVRECIETDWCKSHAVDGERCWSHGGSDPL